MVLFADGFRPFFLAAAAYAAAVMAAWLGLLSAGTTWIPGLAADPLSWHIHEMLYGFAPAVMAGFFLTAVPNWTAAAPIRRGPLILLFCLWLAGRVAAWSDPLLPTLVWPSIELAFVPTLAALAFAPVARARQWRNLLLLAILTLFWLGDVFGFLARLGSGPFDPGLGHIMGLYAVSMLLVVMGQRIIPSFTANHLKRTGHPAPPQPGGFWDRLTLVATLTILCLDLVTDLPKTTGLLFLVLGALHIVALARWRPDAVLDTPLLWILHLSYAWLVLAFVMLGLTRLDTGVPMASALHALTTGGMAGLMLGVMSRAALGHTGRALIAAPPTVAAYVALNGAATVRVLAPGIEFLGGHKAAVTIAGSLWILAFLLFLWVYLPILLGARVDTLSDQR